jgi:hypothetical protein
LIGTAETITSLPNFAAISGKPFEDFNAETTAPQRANLSKLAFIFAALAAFERELIHERTIVARPSAPSGMGCDARELQMARSSVPPPCKAAHLGCVSGAFNQHAV